MRRTHLGEAGRAGQCEPSVLGSWQGCGLLGRVVTTTIAPRGAFVELAAQAYVVVRAGHVTIHRACDDASIFETDQGADVRTGFAPSGRFFAELDVKSVTVFALQ
jgi:hypothetical protein